MLSTIQKITSAVITAALVFVAPCINAGPLGDFEADVREESKASSADGRASVTDPDNDSDSLLDLLFEDAFDGFFDSLFVGATQLVEGSSVDSYVDGSGETGLARREGDVLVPYLRLSASRIDADAAVQGNDIRIELGWEQLATAVRFTRYEDEALAEELDNLSVQFYYRMIYGSRLGVNLGIGYARLEGQQTFDGAVVSLPVMLKINKHLALEYSYMRQDADGAGLDHQEIGLLISKRKIAIRAGYRTFSSANESIDGPYLGLEFIY